MISSAHVYRFPEWVQRALAPVVKPFEKAEAQKEIQQKKAEELREGAKLLFTQPDITENSWQKFITDNPSNNDKAFQDLRNEFGAVTDLERGLSFLEFVHKNKKEEFLQAISLILNFELSGCGAVSEENTKAVYFQAIKQFLEKSLKLEELKKILGTSFITTESGHGAYPLIGNLIGHREDSKQIADHVLQILTKTKRTENNRGYLEILEKIFFGIVVTGIGNKAEKEKYLLDIAKANAQSKQHSKLIAEALIKLQKKNGSLTAKQLIADMNSPGIRYEDLINSFLLASNISSNEQVTLTTNLFKNSKYSIDDKAKFFYVLAKESIHSELIKAALQNTRPEDFKKLYKAAQALATQGEDKSFSIADHLLNSFQTKRNLTQWATIERNKTLRNNSSFILVQAKEALRQMFLDDSFDLDTRRSKELIHRALVA